MRPRSRRLGNEVVALACADELGEGPVWDAAAAELLWVDIFRCLVHRLDPRTGAHSVGAYPGAPIGAVIPRRGGGAIIGAGRELRAIGPEGELGEVLATLDDDRPGNRVNDCRCDPQGRLWAGTMALAGDPGEGTLYRVDADLRPRPMVTGTAISNGIGWDPTAESMYFIDSATQRLDAFEFDAATGTLAGRRPVATIDPEDGLPDGLAVDAEGGIWIALFGGGALHRYAPDGTLEAVLELPVANPTCPAFGGAGMKTLFVTSGHWRRVPADADPGPLGGALLALNVGVPGLPPVAFDG